MPLVRERVRGRHVIRATFTASATRPPSRNDGDQWFTYAVPSPTMAAAAGHAAGNRRFPVLQCHRYPACSLACAGLLVARNLNEWHTGQATGTHLPGHLSRRQARMTGHAVDFTPSNRTMQCPFGGVFTTWLAHDDLAVRADGSVAPGLSGWMLPAKMTYTRTGRPSRLRMRAG